MNEKISDGKRMEVEETEGKKIRRKTAKFRNSQAKIA